MGQLNKLLVEVEGTALVARVVDAALKSRASSVHVVTGAAAADVQDALRDRNVCFVHNPDHDAGMSASLRAGLAGLPTSTTGVLVCLADMPWLRAEYLDLLIEAFASSRAHEVCVPMYQGRRGNPILWPARCFEQMRSLAGDVGARSLLSAPQQVVRHVPMPDAAVHRDVDTIEDLPGKA